MAQIPLHIGRGFAGLKDIRLILVSIFNDLTALKDTQDLVINAANDAARNGVTKTTLETTLAS